ncbi:MAG TPA: SMI1/KNR4 family protein [Chthonomonadaceae bacterium]|nr:SMI1/KNR4 family protein [Chthonomonadaceae bacterium]
MISKEIEDLKTLLGRMQREDPRFRVFGAELHRYILGSPLTENELVAFEQTHRIGLPDDYRLFLKEAGNGGRRRDSNLFMGNTGAGPYYGLLPLEEAACDCDLAQPFPFTTSTEALLEEEIDKLRDPEKYPGMPGALALCHQGSGIFCWLVANGPTYGTIWEGRENCYPTGLSFWTWYRQWIDRLVHRALPRLAAEPAIHDTIMV